MMTCVALHLDRYLDLLRLEGETLLDAARPVLDSPVPSCPEWTAADLVWHIGKVHHFWATIVSERLLDPEPVERVPRPAPNELMDWARAQLEFAWAVLADADPLAEVWTWAPQHDVAFIQRRMPQETSVHRWDAQLAAEAAQPGTGRHHRGGGRHDGAATPAASGPPLRPAAVPLDLAVDGVDEFLDFFVRGDASSGEPGTLHLHATDGEGEWLIAFGQGGYSWHRGHGKGDAAVRAPASDLLLLLWGRVAADSPEVEVIGDEAVVARFRAACQRR